MAGITAYGGYVPLWRLGRDSIAKAWGIASIGGEKSVDSFDEDSITMAVEAGVDCVRGLDRGKVDGLFFASTTFPYPRQPFYKVCACWLNHAFKYGVNHSILGCL